MATSSDPLTHLVNEEGAPFSKITLETPREFFFYHFQPWDVERNTPKNRPVGRRERDGGYSLEVTRGDTSLS